MAERSHSFARTYAFPVPADVFWATISRPEEFTSWWSAWLRSVSVDRFGPGGASEIVLRAPLIPRDFPVRLRIVEYAANERLQVDASGSLVGRAELDVDPTPTGCAVLLKWKLAPGDPVLRALYRVSWPLIEAVSGQVVDLGLRAFERRLAESSADAA